ncbi:unnamed protein product [Parnassius mnemosyne]|uniref:Uncharacterized protein n=1 Tax=Parnassius mnemosyne TaxID=213953 RepID=A0AAV1K623_9NEOP
MSRERSTLRTERCENSTSGMEHSHRGMVGGVSPPSSRVELDAIREPKSTALSFAAWASESSSLYRDGSDGLQKFPWTALARDQNARVPERRRTSFSPILPMCSDFALAITLLKNLDAKLYFFLSVLVFTSRVAEAAVQA